MSEEVEVKPKFEVTQRVTSKKTGLPMTGTIVSVVDSMEFLRSRNLYEAISLNEGFGKHYPDWTNYPVYAVLMDKAQLPYSYEEFMNSLPRNWNLENVVASLGRDNPDIFKYLYNSGKPVQITAYPEQDLELL